MGYRKRLFESYLSNHFSNIRTISLEHLEQEVQIFKSYYMRFLPKSKSAKILDIGCGYGPLLHFLKVTGFREVFGVDISLEQIERARSLGIQEVECADIREFLKDRKGEYDCIFALDVLEHFPKSEAFEFLEQVSRALNRTAV